MAGPSASKGNRKMFALFESFVLNLFTLKTFDTPWAVGPEEMIAFSATDCTGFALQVGDLLKENGCTVDLYLHNSRHGALVWRVDDGWIVIDSAAREAFSLQADECFVNKATKSQTWRREGGNLLLEKSPPFAEVSRKEFAEKTNRLQFESKTLVIMFR